MARPSWRLSLSDLCALSPRELLRHSSGVPAGPRPLQFPLGVSAPARSLLPGESRVRWRWPFPSPQVRWALGKPQEIRLCCLCFSSQIEPSPNHARNLIIDFQPSNLIALALAAQLVGHFLMHQKVAGWITDQSTYSDCRLDPQ
uniref:Uncharacterized protein n=1 Tax=Molossus molossus TaxID=27622 RepID=A0A7J8I9Q1_MOLMO|nr:hypothetical protein HJG59_010689 [Molossus molossus]